MPRFTYQAVDGEGRSQAGEIDSSDRANAVNQLQRLGLVPVSITAAEAAETKRQWSRSALRGLWRRASVPKLNDIVTLTQSLGALLSAGLTIDRALAVAASLSGQSTTAPLLRRLGKEVRSGKSFALAIREAALPVPTYFVGMIEAGEIGGSLSLTLNRLAELMRAEQAVRERVRSALVYPSILAFVVVATIVLLISVVLPRFQILFEESEAPLPWITRVVLNVGQFVSGYWWLLLGLTAVTLAAVFRYLKSAAGRKSLDAWLLRSRLTFGLPVAIDTGRLLRILGTLLANGVHIDTALRIGRGTLTNSVLREGLDNAARMIKAGERPSVALEKVNVFPAVAIQLTRVGEETGHIEDMLVQAASILEEDSRLKLDRLLAMLVPLLTIAMGVVIAGLIGSVLIGLLSVNDLAF